MKNEVFLALQEAGQKSAATLIHELNPNGYWLGELSSSALSTSVATFALSQHPDFADYRAIAAGIKWLVDHQNLDGGWGDTPAAPSNVSTTLLAWAALTAETGIPHYCNAIRQAEQWLCKYTQHGIGIALPGSKIASAVLHHYGQDRTFSTPILAMLALAERLGNSKASWDYVPQLPFEAVLVPHQLWAMLGLPVVSYAMPALIGLGRLKHFYAPSKYCFWMNMLRDYAIPKAMKTLQNMQPESGGFLEAIPLTGFVSMSLSAIREYKHPVAQKAAKFLINAQREDGSWPIDMNLSVWLTSLSLEALTISHGNDSLAIPYQTEIAHWLFSQQSQRIHPFTYARPGGWGWSHLQGAVPDGDDTSMALAAIRKLGKITSNQIQAGIQGISWLLSIQNADYGIPTFCRGWTKLPFDQSCPDITAHALYAMAAWVHDLPAKWQKRVQKAIKQMIQYLTRNQAADGSWLPLWFGNPDDPQHQNRTYGTSQVISALSKVSCLGWPEVLGNCQRAIVWCVQNQNPDGGWGSRLHVQSQIEETALAIAALCDAREAYLKTAWQSEYDLAIENGLQWLLQATNQGQNFPASPIGLYFASLWYSEKLYPLIFTVAAFRKAILQFQNVS